MLTTRRGLLTLTAVAALAMPAAGALAAAAPATPTAAQMIALQDKYMATLAGTDMAALDDMISETVSYGHPTGQINTKKIQMDSMRGGPLPRYGKIEQANTVVRAYPGVAVLSGDIIFTGLARAGSPPPARNTYRLATAYANEKGTWRLILWQVLPIAPPRPAAPPAAPAPAQ